MSPRARTIEVVVNGLATPVLLDRRWCIGTLVDVALLHAGVPASKMAAREWELRAADGRLIEHNIKIRDTKLMGGQKLFLAPAVGIGA